MMTLPNRPGYVVSERRVDTHTSGGNLAEHHDTKAGFPLHQLVHQQSPLHGMLPQDSIGQLAYLPNTNFPLLSSTTKKSPPFSPSPFVGADSLSTGIVSSSPPPSSPTAPAPSSRLLLSHDPYKSLGLEHLSPEEIHEKKVLLQKHRLQPHMLQIIDYCKKEGIIPTLPPNLIQPNAPTDYSLSEFLELQGIELPEDDYELKNDEFSFKLNQLKVAYNEELEKLNKVCQDFITRMVGLLREQGQIRQVAEQELQAKTILIQNKFDYVRNQLRTNVCNAIRVLQKQYNHQSIKKRRRSLSKKATDVLNRWFFDHINDPYPSDEEKSMLAAQCVLSLNQVNNWFGNKRIRYKRKCTEGNLRQLAKTGLPTALVVSPSDLASPSGSPLSPISPYSPSAAQCTL